MDESEILALPQRHDESALAIMEQAYAARLRALATGIVSASAAEECVNDALFAAWNAIPPAEPAHLFAYLCKLTRNLALDRCRAEAAQKRGGSVLRLSLDELGECVSAPAAHDPAAAVDAAALHAAINAFLRTQPAQARALFLARYFYAMPLREIAARFGLREGSVKSTLSRTRKRLRAYLEQEELL